MEYYDALIAKWATLPHGDTIAQKLSAINALTVAGPNINVHPSQIVRYLALNRKLAALLKYAANPPSTEAGVCASELAALLAMGTSAPAFHTSKPADYSALQGMLTDIASDTNSGITESDVADLLAMTATSVPWASAAVAVGGGGLNSATIVGSDLIAAGLTTLTTSAPTNADDNVLNFSSVPAWLVAGMEVHDLGIDQTDIPEETFVQSVTAATVTMTKSCIRDGIASGDVIGFC